MYEAVTRDIKVTVEPDYLENQSSPTDDHYVWAYHVRIENVGGETVQLRTRHWRITDALGHTQEVRGPGVIGEQPVLPPGESLGTPAARRCPRRPGSWSARTGWKRPTAVRSTSISRRFRWIARINREASIKPPLGRGA